jgi:hypothetical protein
MAYIAQDNSYQTGEPIDPAYAQNPNLSALPSILSSQRNKNIVIGALFVVVILLIFFYRKTVVVIKEGPHKGVSVEMPEISIVNHLISPYDRYVGYNGPFPLVKHILLIRNTTSGIVLNDRKDGFQLTELVAYDLHKKPLCASKYSSANYLNSTWASDNVGLGAILDGDYSENAPQFTTRNAYAFRESYQGIELTLKEATRLSSMEVFVKPDLSGRGLQGTKYMLLSEAREVLLEGLFDSNIVRSQVIEFPVSSR